jgi:hypothetical protein
MPLYPEEENLAKVVKFDKGPISAIGLRLEIMRPAAGERPGDMVIYTRPAALTPQMRLKLQGPVGQIGAYGIYWGSLSTEQAWYIPLEYDIRPERQLRKIVNRLEEDGLITSEQREKAYNELGLGEDLYNRPTKEGRVL